MTRKPSLLIFAGSTRKKSLNIKLAKEVISLMKDSSIEFLHLKDYPLPIYDGDIEDESGVPENARAIRNKMINADGIILCSPEYNSTVSPLLKNVLDWTSRADTNVANLAPTKNKPFLLLGSSPGKLSGLRGLFSLRDILLNMSAFLYPKVYALQPLSSELEADLLDEKRKKDLSTLIATFESFVGNLTEKKE